MSRRLFGGIAFVLLGSCSGNVSLQDRPCPCVTGYTCCAAVNLCVAAPAPASCNASPNEPTGKMMSSEVGVEAGGGAMAVAHSSSVADTAGAAGTTEEAPQSVHDRWLAMSAAPLAARYDHSAVWTGDRDGNGALVIWGGLDQQTNPGVPLGDGARYYPREDRWATISTVNAPAARFGAVAVWTGSRVLLWGGSPLQDKAAYSYDPSADAWQAMPSCACALYTDSAFATWTGTELLVFDAGHGARFEPNSGTWRELSTAGAPYARFGSAVWTGNVWILWGGAKDSAQVFAHSSIGAKYDPKTDTWAPVSALGAPSARENPHALWTGSRMIIWGGFEPTTDDYAPGMIATDAAAYDPETDRWTALPSLTSTPLLNAAAVNTGSSMLVWGVHEDPNLPASGARLDFATDTWTPLSSIDQPQHRMQESATWTGTELVVWGGNDGPAALASGARYFP